MKNLFVLIGFDVEHDVEPLSDSSDGVKKGIPIILDVLDRLDITCTFNILANIIDDNFEYVKQIKAHGHEIGCHSYDHEALAFLPEKEVQWRVELATKEIQQKINARPVTFRAPYLLGSTYHIKSLCKLNYLIDSSYSIAHDNQQVLPYHPSYNDWHEKGTLKLLELPVSGNPFEPDAEKSDFWPWWRISDIKTMQGKINQLLSKQSEYGEEHVITFYFHPWEFIDLKDTTIAVPDDFHERIFGGTGKKALSAFKEILLWLKNEKGGTFMTMKEFRNVWTELKHQ